MSELFTSWDTVVANPYRDIQAAWLKLNGICTLDELKEMTDEQIDEKYTEERYHANSDS
jgi:hypothetical protein